MIKYTVLRSEYKMKLANLTKLIIFFVLTISNIKCKSGKGELNSPIANLIYSGSMIIPNGQLLIDEDTVRLEAGIPVNEGLHGLDKIRSKLTSLQEVDLLSRADTKTYRFPGPDLTIINKAMTINSCFLACESFALELVSTSNLRNNPKADLTLRDVISVTGFSISCQSEGFTEHDDACFIYYEVYARAMGLAFFISADDMTHYWRETFLGRTGHLAINKTHLFLNDAHETLCGCVGDRIGPSPEEKVRSEMKGKYFNKLYSALEIYLNGVEASLINSLEMLIEQDHYQDSNLGQIYSIPDIITELKRYLPTETSKVRVTIPPDLKITLADIITSVILNPTDKEWIDTLRQIQFEKLPRISLEKLHHTIVSTMSSLMYRLLELQKEFESKNLIRLPLQILLGPNEDPAFYSAFIVSHFGEYLSKGNCYDIIFLVENYKSILKISVNKILGLQSLVNRPRRLAIHMEQPLVLDQYNPTRTNSLQNDSPNMDDMVHTVSNATILKDDIQTGSPQDLLNDLDFNFLNRSKRGFFSNFVGSAFGLATADDLAASVQFQNRIRDREVALENSLANITLKENTYLQNMKNMSSIINTVISEDQAIMKTMAETMKAFNSSDSKLDHITAVLATDMKLTLNILNILSEISLLSAEASKIQTTINLMTDNKVDRSLFKQLDLLELFGTTSIQSVSYANIFVRILKERIVVDYFVKKYRDPLEIFYIKTINIKNRKLSVNSLIAVDKLQNYALLNPHILAACVTVGKSRICDRNIVSIGPYTTKKL